MVRVPATVSWARSAASILPVVALSMFWAVKVRAWPCRRPLVGQGACHGELGEAGGGDLPGGGVVDALGVRVRSPAG